MASVIRALLCAQSDGRAKWFAEVFRGVQAEVECTLANGVLPCIERMAEPHWDVVVCDVPRGAGRFLDGFPGPEARAELPLIIVAEELSEVLAANYRLQAHLCSADNAEQLRLALAAVQNASVSQRASVHAFERGQREIIEQILKGAPLRVTLDRIVRLVERQGEEMFCTILLLDADQRVVPVSTPSLPPEFGRAFTGARIGPKEGSCGAAMYLRRPVVTADIEHHENWAKYREPALAAGLRGSWSSPILSGDGEVLGAFAMYYREPREPREVERAWVERATYLAAITLQHDRRAEALRVSEARYRQIVNTAYEGVWLLDADARTSFVNARAAELLGYSIQEMLGRSLFEFMEDDARAEAEAHFLRRQQHISEQHEFRFRRKDGTPLFALVAASPLLDERGEMIGALGMLTDITPLKRAEQTLSENELELRTIFENAGLGIALVDSDGRPRRSNTALQRMLGYSNEELQRMRFAEFTHPDDAAVDVDLYTRMLRREIDSYRLEKRFLHKDGHVVWGRVTAALVRMGDGLLAIATVEDISEHKRAEERISAQAALLDQATDAIMVRSCEGVIEYWNKGAERIYGWSSAEAVGRNVLELLYRDAKQFHDAQARLLAADAWSGQLLHYNRAGNELMIEGRWTLLRDEAGRPKNVLTINSDVTEKKRLEVQVISAQRMESLGTLAGGIAHDFNNILAAILANVSLAADDLSADHPAQTALSEINEAGLRAAALVRQILTFSRRRAPERRVIRLESVVNEALKLLRATLPAHIRIDVHVDPEAPEVFADPTQVHQVVMNLCTNAAHAMRLRGGVLMVNCERAHIEREVVLSLGELAPGNYARLVVEDTGVGMSTETLARIFDPFFTTKSPGEGTGLGLSVVHGVMRAHDGGVRVESSVGRGSRFELYFPEARASAENAVPRTRVARRGRGERVLCIDDEASLARATTQLLERLGYAAVAHTHPTKALEDLARDPLRFDAVVTDCSMPLIWGLEFVREIRRLRPEMPIVMTSGLIEPGLEKSLRELGIREFIAKPGTIEELGTALQRALGVNPSLLPR
ncbi:MAG: PAS domain S-box protein [Myxococcota bacterium]